VKVRSTGLGQTEMVLGITGLTRGGDCLILQGKSSEPVTWKIRVALSYRDVWRVVKLALFSKNIFFLIAKTLGFKSAEKVSWPNDF